ncbi:MAG: TraR/DksA C4-type zinc finger protein [Thalassotalea sp.]|nr:TraR/DksA C4-type zinc finger protein [Thalassotalea sp.]
MNKIFGSFKQASEYAKSMVKLGLTSVKCKPSEGDKFEVLIDTKATAEILSLSKVDKVAHAPTTPKPKPKSKINKEGYCSECGKKIPQARLQVAPNSKYCVACLSLMESTNPDVVSRSIDVDGIGGSREDARRTLRNRHR